jgi:hypothetical protein
MQKKTKKNNGEKERKNEINFFMSTLKYCKKGPKKIKNKKGKKNLVFVSKACKSFLVEFHTP